MSTSVLEHDDVEIVRRALSSCADDLMSTPPDGLAPAYVHAIESLAKGTVAEWPYTDTIGRELLMLGSELAPGESWLPESVKPFLRPLAAAALQRYAMEIEQESGGELEDGSAEAAEVDRAVQLADMMLEPTVNVEARRWSGGWELHALGSKDLVTQVEHLDDPPAMVQHLL